MLALNQSGSIDHQSVQNRLWEHWRNISTGMNQKKSYVHFIPDQGCLGPLYFVHNLYLIEVYPILEHQAANVEFYLEHCSTNVKFKREHWAVHIRVAPNRGSPHRLWFSIYVRSLNQASECQIKSKESKSSYMRNSKNMKYPCIRYSIQHIPKNGSTNVEPELEYLNSFIQEAQAITCWSLM